MSLPGRLIDVDGVRLYVHEEGVESSAPPVVFLHGWTTSHYTWRHVLAAWQTSGGDTRRLIAVDLPGFGESDRPSPRRYDYSPAGLAATTWRLLDLMGVPRVSLVGQSMGGTVAVHMAASRAHAIDRVVVVDGALGEPVLPMVAQTLRVPFAGVWALRAGASRTVIGHFMRSELYADPAKVTTQWIEYVWERLHRPGGIEAAQAALAALFDLRATHEALLRVTAPLHLIWGEHDRVCPISIAERTLVTVAGSTLDVIAGAGHEPHEEQPIATARVIAARVAGRMPPLVEPVP